jgi:hypothetical protein
MVTDELDSFNVQLKQDIASALEADVSRIQVTHSLSLLPSVSVSVAVAVSVSVSVSVSVCVYRQG